MPKPTVTMTMILMTAMWTTEMQLILARVGDCMGRWTRHARARSRSKSLLNMPSTTTPSTRSASAMCFSRPMHTQLTLACAAGRSPKMTTQNELSCRVGGAWPRGSQGVRWACRGGGWGWEGWKR
eukprot:3680654-Rhodomonas_salina.2